MSRPTFSRRSCARTLVPAAALAALALSAAGPAAHAAAYQTYAKSDSSVSDIYNTLSRISNTPPPGMPITVGKSQSDGDFTYVDGAATTSASTAAQGADTFQEFVVPFDTASTGPTTPVNWYTHANSTSNSSASVGGTLHAYAIAHADVDPATVNIIWNDATGDHAYGRYTPYLMRSNASASAGWRDTFDITSSTLPADTDVDLKVTVVLESNVTPANSKNITTAYARAALQIWGQFDSIIDLQNSGVTPYLTASKIISWPVGHQLRLQGVIEASVAARAFADGVNGIYGTTDGYADAANTGHFYIEPVDPNVTAVAESGTTYLSPEPSTALFALTLAGATATLRRRPTR